VNAWRKAESGNTYPLASGSSRGKSSERYAARKKKRPKQVSVARAVGIMDIKCRGLRIKAFQCSISMFLVRYAVALLVHPTAKICQNDDVKLLNLKCTE
jgi:hypothetical protein